MFIGFEEIKLITEIYNIVGNLLLECNNLGYKRTDFKSVPRCKFSVTDLRLWMKNR